jgi:hypothetical protein
LPTIEIDSGTLKALLGEPPTSDRQIALATPANAVGQRNRRSSPDPIAVVTVQDDAQRVYWFAPTVRRLGKHRHVVLAVACVG